jgi:hypothetical protein
MPSTYTDILRLELQADGENDGTWGQILNDNVIALVEDAIAGTADVSTTGGTTALTTNDGAEDQARKRAINVTGSLASDAIIEVPAQTKPYRVINGTSGSFTVEVLVSGQSAGNGVVVPQGFQQEVWCDGTNVEPTSLPLDYSGSAYKITGTVDATSADIEFLDNKILLVGSTDDTKKVNFQVDNLTTSTTRTLTVQDASGTLALLDHPQSWDEEQIFTDRASVARSTVGVNYTSVDQFTVGDGTGNQGIVIDSGPADLGRLTFGDGALAAYIQYNHDTDVLSFHGGGSGFERARIDSSGNLLVGTTTTNPAQTNNDGIELAPDNLISVNNTGGVPVTIGRGDTGTLIIWYYQGSTGIGSINTDGSTTSYNTGSDRRRKENDRSIFDAVQRVKNTGWTAFDFIETGAYGEGIIAQDEVKRWPTVVSQDDTGWYMADYSKMVPALGAALSEALDRIEALETKLN